MSPRLHRDNVYQTKSRDRHGERTYRLSWVQDKPATEMLSNFSMEFGAKGVYRDQGEEEHSAHNNPSC